jgi:magnesium-transporting ATPase (P-type)
MESKYNECARKGERVIAIAVSEDGVSYYLLALAILKDRVRKGVKEAVDTVLHAGVQVVMITGDSKETAKTIALECGILKNTPRELVLSRDELDKMSDEELALAIPNLRVVARALPQDKSRLVRVSQGINLVVGMTGDGVNDAPSLKLSDVGFAMGSGTDIAREAGFTDGNYFARLFRREFGQTPREYRRDIAKNI